ncbi:phosphoglycolate phosphatase [hydrocarbon metagenome]|uniref:Phosphoglycolate phosphatase n=1 Tax=hydrocarbon metagenome TaxID=938273 RepID=A0A0W8E7E2_9ZZZZ
MIKLCVFDLDGTLVNSLEDIAASTNYALIKNGFPPREMREFPFMVGDGVLMLLQRALGDAYQPQLDIKLLEDFNYYYNSHCADLTRPYEGIKELLNHLLEHNIQLGVLSNKTDQFTKVIAAEMFPDITFARVQGLTDRFPGKPDPASLLDILDELQVHPEEALYIGDANIDVFTAHNAGIKIAGAAWGFRGEEELIEAGADFIVKSADEIVKILSLMNNTVNL